MRNFLIRVVFVGFCVVCCCFGYCLGQVLAAVAPKAFEEHPRLPGKTRVIPNGEVREISPPR